MGAFFSQNPLAALYAGLSLTFIMGVVAGGAAVCICRQWRETVRSRKARHAQ